MDPVKILKRALHILWSYKALWIFGIILALTTAAGSVPSSNGSHGSSGSHTSSSGTAIWQASNPFENSKQFTDWLHQAAQPLQDLPQRETAILIGITIALVVVLLVIAVVLAFARYIAETALIRMVDEYETSGNKPGIGKGFRMGWSRTSWRLFLINLLVSLPVLVLVLLMTGLGIGAFFLVAAGNVVLSVIGIMGGIATFVLFIFVLIVVAAILVLLRYFFWRACAIKQVGVFEAIRLGFGMVRRHLKDVFLMWLIMIGVSIVIAIAMFIAVFLLIPVLVITMAIGIIVGGLPALIVGGLSSLFLGSPLSWIVGILFGLPLFLLVTGSPLIFLRGLVEVFKSTVWTLVYRELDALENMVPIDLNPPEEEQPTVI
jgi:hypothetical protein